MSGEIKTQIKAGDSSTRGQAAERRRARDLATERLSNPDQLDQVIEITRFPDWVALGALLLLVAGAVAAGIWLPVRLTVSGEGILIHLGGIQTVISDTEGRLEQILVQPGTRVEAGQVVARVAQPQMADALRDLDQELDELRRRRATVLSFHERSLGARESAIADRRRALGERHGFAMARLELLEKQLETERGLIAEGILSQRRLGETQTQVNDARDAVNVIDNEVRAFKQVLAEARLDQERELLDLELEIHDLERRAESTREDYARRCAVRSPYQGRVVELRVNPGEIVGRGSALMSLLPDDNPGEDLEAVLYVPPAEGKKVREGMRVLLAPTSVKKEEFGFLLGEVRWVAEVPSTPEGMERVLQNTQLVQQLSRDHAPFEVLVALCRDPETRTDLVWSSSSEGPKQGIRAGTLTLGEVVTERKRLISVAIPIFGRLFDDPAVGDAMTECVLR